MNNNFTHEADNNKIEEIIDFVDRTESELSFEEINSNEETKDLNYQQQPQVVVKNKLYFKPREWKFNPDCRENVGERSMITDMNGNITEAWCIGRWTPGRYLTEIQTDNLSLKKHSDYIFTFWLNGGENDRFQEICQLQIVFDGDYANRYTFKLNRDIIKPIKSYRGWVLFEIPFSTGNNDYTRLKFVVQDAPTAILPAMDKEAYDLLPNEKLDPRIPQRHNIVFENGFPYDSKWSCLVYGEDRFSQKAKNVFNNIGGAAGNFAGNFGKIAGETAEKATEFAKKAIDFTGDKAKDLKRSAVNSEFFKNHILNDIDYDKLEDEIEEVMSDISEEIEDELRDEIENSIRDDIKDNLKAELREEIMKEISKKFDKLFK